MIPKTIRKIMSRKVEDTEIYRYSYEATMVALNIVKNMDNKFKATVGDRLMQHSLNLLDLISNSIKCEDKEHYLKQVEETTSKILTISRLCKDNRLCSVKSQSQLIENLLLVESNVSKWRSYLKRRSKLTETNPQGWSRISP